MAFLARPGAASPGPRLGPPPHGRIECPIMTNRLLSAALVAAILGGCAKPDVSALSVAVSDAITGAPIAGAKVVADTPSHNHPLSIESMLGQTAPVQSIAYTDERGVAVLEYATGRSVRVGVMARGYPLLVENVDQPWLGDFDLLGDEDPGRSARLRARVAPAPHQ